MSKFLETLFDPHQVSCFTESPHGYRVSKQPYPEDLFFCINALHPIADLCPVREWHRADLPRRADCNVVCYRNFLIELDAPPLDKQVAYITDEIPVTSIVYSGGKSHHFIVSLAEPLTSADEYKNLASRLLSLFPDADPTCKNPSRLSRLPGPLRPETNKKQELIYLGTRIPLQTLDALLPPVELRSFKSRSSEEVKQFITPILISAVTSPDEFMSQHGIKGRNAFAYYLGCRFKDLDLSMDTRYKYLEIAYSNLNDTTDFTFEEALAAARINK